jgi:hypothetical protein
MSSSTPLLHIDHRTHLAFLFLRFSHKVIRRRHPDLLQRNQLQEGQKYSKQLHFKTFVAVAVVVE